MQIPRALSALVMTSENIRGEYERKYPTLAKRRLGWGTRKPVLISAIFQTVMSLKLQMPRAGRARDDKREHFW